MNEKLPAVVNHPAPEGLRRRPRTLFPHLHQTLLLVLALVVVYSVHKIPTLKQYPTQSLAIKRVPLEVHIITKCGNAKVALTELILPTVERVYDTVDFKLSIIAGISEDGAIECKHGPEECKGSIMELCAQETHDPWTTLRFVECLTNEFERIPDRAFYEECSSKHSIDLEAVDRCAARDGGAYGLKLLRESAQHTIDMGVRISGTVRLNEEIYCIRDKGKWTNCPNGAGVDDLVDAIEQLRNTTAVYVNGAIQSDNYRLTRYS